MSKKRGLIFLVSMLALLFSVSLVSAQTEGIPLQKDIFLGVPILGPEDLPEAITFTLYDAQNGLTPLGSQTFTRGQYTVDFEFSQSDGVTGGSVARVKADFTETLNLKDASGQTVKPRELWAALEVAGTEVGPRTRVSDETMVQLLLNSDASLATYLTLAYEGDENPLTTIYKSLPLSALSPDGSAATLNNYFSALTEDSKTFGATENWTAVGSGAYILGNVGIGTTSPEDILHIEGAGATAVRQRSIGGGVTWRTNVRGDTGQFRITEHGVATHLAIDKTTGNVGIGTVAPGTYKLAVAGKIRAEEILVDTGWADFVFEPGYKLLSLNEVESHIPMSLT